MKAYNENRDVGAEYTNLVKAMTLPKVGSPLERSFGVAIIRQSLVGIVKQLALLVCIIANCLPFSLVDSPHFKTWMAHCGASFPSRGTLMKLLKPLYCFVLDSMEEQFIKCGVFCTTCDLWTSLSGTHYLIVTYHALDPDFRMITAPLDLIPMGCSAFGEFIYLAISARFKQHRFDDLVHSASFSDSGSNVVLAKELLTPKDAEPCFNHNVKHSHDDVCVGSPSNPALCRVAALDFLSMALVIAAIRGTSVLRAAFTSALKTAELPDLELIAANLTRWEGRVNALKRILALRQAFVHITDHLRPYIEKSPLSFPEDFLLDAYWKRLEVAYKPVLDVLHAISKKAQAQHVPTLSSVPHWVHMSLSACTVSENDGSVTKEFKEAMFTSLTHRMSVFVTIVRDDDGDAIVIPNAIKAAILDPRHSRETCARLSSQDLHDIRAIIIEDTVALFPENRQDLVADLMPRAWDLLLAQLDKAADLQLDGEGCLAWWRNFSIDDAKYGNTYSPWIRSARMYLAMPAGGAPSEIGFSSTGEMVTKKRNSLGDETLEQMTIVRHYVRQPGFDFVKMAEAIGESAAEAIKAIDALE